MDKSCALLTPGLYPSLTDFHWILLVQGWGSEDQGCDVGIVPRKVGVCSARPECILSKNRGRGQIVMCLSYLPPGFLDSTTDFMVVISEGLDAFVPRPNRTFIEPT